MLKSNEIKFTNALRCGFGILTRYSGALEQIRLGEKDPSGVTSAVGIVLVYR